MLLNTCELLIFYFIANKIFKLAVSLVNISVKLEFGNIKSKTLVLIPIFQPI